MDEINDNIIYMVDNKNQYILSKSKKADEVMFAYCSFLKAAFKTFNGEDIVNMYNTIKKIKGIEIIKILDLDTYKFTTNNNPIVCSRNKAVVKGDTSFISIQALLFTQIIITQFKDKYPDIKRYILKCFKSICNSEEVKSKLSIKNKISMWR